MKHVEADAVELAAGHLEVLFVLAVVIANLAEQGVALGVVARVQDVLRHRTSRGAVPYPFGCNMTRSR